MKERKEKSCKEDKTKQNKTKQTKTKPQRRKRAREYVALQTKREGINKEEENESNHIP